MSTDSRVSTIKVDTIVKNTDPLGQISAGFRLLGRNRAIPRPNQADLRLLSEGQGMGSLRSDPGNVGR